MQKIELHSYIDEKEYETFGRVCFENIYSHFLFSQIIIKKLPRYQYVSHFKISVHETIKRKYNSILENVWKQQTKQEKFYQNKLQRNV